MANPMDGRLRKGSAVKKSRNIGEYVESGKRVSQKGYVKLGSKNAELLKELYESKSPLILQKKEFADKVGRMYWDKGMSTAKISKVTGVPQNSVLNTMYMFGIPVRDRVKFFRSEEGRKMMGELAKKHWASMTPSQKREMIDKTHGRTMAARYKVLDQYSKEYAEIKKDLLTKDPFSIQKSKKYFLIPGHHMTRMMNKAIEELIKEGKI